MTIDNVTVTAEPTGYTNTFTEGGASVAIADTDSLITNPGERLRRDDPHRQQLPERRRCAHVHEPGRDYRRLERDHRHAHADWHYDGRQLPDGDRVDPLQQHQRQPATGARTITFVVRDVTTGASSNTARATINVVGINDAPVAVNDTATAIEAGGVANATAVLDPAGNVLTNDTDVTPAIPRPYRQSPAAPWAWRRRAAMARWC